MSNDSVEVQLARVSVQLAYMLKDMEASTLGRKAQYEAIEKLNKTVGEMNIRLQNVEKQMASAQPTIEEFITIKHKVVGAGAVGKWLWIGGAALLGFIAASREAIFTWLKG